MNARIIWGYWFMTIAALVTSMFFEPRAIYLSMAATALHAIHFYIREPKLFSLGMQVRYTILAALVAGLLPSLGWLYWVLLAGGALRLATGYCLTARVLALMPFNRDRKMNWSLLKAVIFTPTIPGSALKLVSSK